MTTWFTVLAESSLRVTLAAVLVAATLAAVRVRSSRARHAAWTAVLIAMLALPLSSFGPRIDVRVPVPASAARVIAAVPDYWSPDRPADVSPDRDAAAPIALPASVPAAVAPSGLYVPQAAPRMWPQVLAITYGVGCAWFALRLLVGIVGMRRLLRASRPVAVTDAGVVVSTSTAVSVPVTVGIMRPSVILPADAQAWPAGRRAAVLAHEAEHIRRRDPLVLFLAHVNRCVFWFHPLAWWLERTLTATAEEACDVAGVRAMGESRGYAQVLVDLAASVRARRGRVSWQGVGIDGAGMLGRRIDRILRGDITRRLSRGQTALLTAGCVAVIVAAIACRQKVEAEPLKPDPTLAERLATQQARQALYDAARDMTVQDVADAEARVTSNPEDLDTRRKLLWFYDVSGQRVLGWNAMVAARRPHVLWLVEHHPEVDIAVARGVTPKIDPVGYAEAKKLWSRYLTQPDVSPKVLGNAARFFAVADKPVAETILLRLQREDPDGPTPRIVGDIFYPPWKWRLALLYASAIVGSDDEMLGYVVKSVSLAEAHGPFALGVRKKLDETTDAELLSQTGSLLVNNASNAKVDFDFRALGEGYMRRALVLDPNGTSIRNRLASLDQMKAERARSAELRAKEAELAGGDLATRVAAGKTLTWDDNSRLEAFQEQAVNALPEDRRFLEAARQAAHRIMSAENDASQNRNDAAAASWKLAARYAQMVLALAPKYHGQSGHDDAVNTANLALALHALHEGDVNGAVRYMNEAAKTPALGDNGLEYRAVNYLLHAGERESVAVYLERVAPASPQQKDRKLADAAAIRKGVMPPSYQSMYAR